MELVMDQHIEAGARVNIDLVARQLMLDHIDRSRERSEGARLKSGNRPEA
jgi:hypothetical protein